MDTRSKTYSAIDVFLIHLRAARSPKTEPRSMLRIRLIRNRSCNCNGLCVTTARLAVGPSARTETTPRERGYPPPRQNHRGCPHPPLIKLSQGLAGIWFWWNFECSTNDVPQKDVRNASSVPLSLYWLTVRTNAHVVKTSTIVIDINFLRCRNRWSDETHSPAKSVSRVFAV